ncbi:hypothetical protein ACLOJK_008594 [Asimina triloba]
MGRQSRYQSGTKKASEPKKEREIKGEGETEAEEEEGLGGDLGGADTGAEREPVLEQSGEGDGGKGGAFRGREKWRGREGRGEEARAMRRRHASRHVRIINALTC